MKRLLLFTSLLLVLLLMAACGGSRDSDETPTAPGALQVLDATFALGLDDQMGAVDPGNTFEPDQDMYLSVRLRGNPATGTVAARFYYEQDLITEASLDLAEMRQGQGLLFVVGGNTQVGFSLTHDEPFPISSDYRAELYLNDERAATYPFSVVRPASALSPRLNRAVLAKGSTDDYQPINPTETFGPDDNVYLVGSADLGIYSSLVANWYVSGRLDEAGTRSLTMQDNVPDAGFYFFFVPAGGWPEGRHRVALSVDGQQVSSMEFDVVAQVATGPGGRPALTGENVVSINALWYATDASGRSIGGVSPTRISVRPATTRGQLRVGFFEEEVRGSGRMWESAGWTAVVVSSQLLGIDPRDYEFSYAVGGRIDGPSAGMYMTVGTVAALLGDAMPQDMAMTGTINPDGTIGPVGGIPQKIEGAAEMGVRLVLVPAGLRYDVDGNTGQLVDVVEVGRRLNVEVREVSTVFEAYELLTGKALPQPATSTASPSLPQRAFDRTRAKAQEWLARYEDARGRITSLSPEIIEFFVDGILSADASAAGSRSALQQGLAAVAYQRAVQAAAEAQLWQLAGDIVQRYLVSDLSAAIDYLFATRAAMGEMDALLELLRTEQPRSASDHVALFDAYANIGRAQGLVLLAEGQLNTLSENAANMAEEDVLSELVEIAAYYTLARDLVRLARDSVEIGFGYGSGADIDPQRVEAMSELLRRASDANVTYFETTVIDQYAEAWGVHPSVAQNAFMSYDYDYLFTIASEAGVNALGTTLRDASQRIPLVLGNSVGNYVLSASLVAKHYSLGAELDEFGDVVYIAQERALADMLDLADRRARELINLNGADTPVTAILYYENGRLQRQGGPQQQLDALQSYWSAAALAQIQAYLSGVIGQ